MRSEKRLYDVMADGKVYKWCWPNAGKMCAIHDTPQKEWTKADGILIRVSADHPAD